MISTGDIAGGIIVVCCILWTGYFLFYGKKAGRHLKTDEEMPENNENVVGISKTRLGQYADNSVWENANKRGVVPPEEMEKVFYTREEARLNIDVDMEPLNPLNDEIDEEDFLHFEETEFVPVLATGASFDELAEMSDVIQSHLHDLSQAHIVKAAKTIKSVENTNLMEQLIGQIEGGEQKVADILDRCEAELVGQVKPQSDVDDAEGFDLGRYL
ncbi:MAG: hypothetical protein ACK5M7_08735 [Draconibacterium sp.]